MVANLDIPLSELLAAINAVSTTPVTSVTKNQYGVANLDVSLSSLVATVS